MYQPALTAPKAQPGLPVRTDIRAGITIRIELPESATVQTVADTTTATAATTA